MMKRKILSLAAIAAFGMVLTSVSAQAAPAENITQVAQEQKPKPAQPAPTPTPKPRKPGPRDEGDGE